LQVISLLFSWRKDGRGQCSQVGMFTKAYAIIPLKNEKIFFHACV
jgi:hypothetical protein